MNKRYLGDGVYASVDAPDLILTTENGVRVIGRIVLEPGVLAALLDYLNDWRQEELPSHRLDEPA